MNTKPITQFFVKNPTIFWSLVVAIVFAGILSFMMMPKLEDPAVSGKQAMVIVPFQGASAHEIELKVAQVMEDQLRTLPDVYEIRSECQNDLAMITVEFEMTVLNKDLEQHFDLLRRKVNDAKPKLPQECYDPIVVDDMMDVYGIFYSLSGDGYSYPELDEYARLIRRELLTVKGVKRINIVGNRDEVINITLSKEIIARNSLIPTEIMMSLQSASQTVNAGKLQNGDKQYGIKVNDAIRNEEDVKNLLITTLDGNQMHIGDVATVKREYAEPQRNGFFVNGKQALAICITLNENVIVPDVGKEVDRKLAEVMKRVPAGMDTQKIFFQPDKVNTAINTFMVNLLESVVIVIVVLMFAMGFRSGLIIGTGLLLTITVSFPILLMLGSTLQRISLGAFIIAMGMLVDNSIVIMDGILIDKQRGTGPKSYLYRIGNHTAMPLLGATVIAVSTFLSTYLSPDTAGEYCRDMFLVLCVSLLASWVLALVQVPVCAKSWLPVRQAKGSADQNQVMNSPMHRFVRKAISALIEHKKITISTAVALLVVCMAGMTQVKNLFFPDFDYNQFVIEYQLPNQTSPDRVKHDLLEITRYLQKNKRVTNVAASMGTAPAHYCLVRPMTNGGDSYGELMVDCKDFGEVQKLVNEIGDPLRKAYPDAYIRFRKYNFSIKTSHTVEVIFKGPDPAVLRDLSAQAENIMRLCKYVDPYSVENNWKPKGKTLVANYVQQDALRSGLNRGNVADALLAATDGLPCGVIHENERMILINLAVRNEDGSKIQDLQNIPVWSLMSVNVDKNQLAGIMTGSADINSIKDHLFQSKPLSNVTSDLHMEWDEDFIYRVNGQRAIEAECDPNTNLYEGTTAKVQQEIKSRIDAIPLPEGYSMEWGGEVKVQKDSSYNIVKYLPIPLFLILGILLILFNNWKEVFQVVGCLPFVFCGIVPSLLLFRQPFTFMAIIGLMGLIGMMVKNGIVLVDEINRLYKEEHQHPYQAVLNATVSRVRPVIMASLTTILGMAPLLGDPMYGSMAICIMAGLTMGTLITLILLPIFYTALFHVHKPETLNQ